MIDGVSCQLKARCRLCKEEEIFWTPIMLDREHRGALFIDEDLKLPKGWIWDENYTTPVHKACKDKNDNDVLFNYLTQKKKK